MNKRLIDNIESSMNQPIAKKVIAKKSVVVKKVVTEDPPPEDIPIQPTHKDMIKQILADIKAQMVIFENKPEGAMSAFAGEITKIGDWEVKFLAFHDENDVCWNADMSLYIGKDERRMNYTAPAFNEEYEFNDHIVYDWLCKLKLCPYCADMPTIQEMCDGCFLAHRKAPFEIKECELCAGKQLAKYMFEPECCMRENTKYICGDCIKDLDNMPNKSCPFCRNEEEFRKSRRRFLDEWHMDG